MIFKRFSYLLCSLCFLFGKAQVANYIANGSFEEHYTCAPFYPLSLAKNWLSIDSTSFAGVYRSKCDMSVPLNGSGFQIPKTGEAYVQTTLYCLIPGCKTGYFKNRLKKQLESGKTYCVKFHVNITDKTPRGMDGFGMYFGDSTIDTITKCNIPLSYLVPQVQNPLGNVITDTLNWIPVTGTFVANGTEKYALLGNFLADAAVTTVSLNSPYYPQYWTDVSIDDVSCIEVNLPAFAGADKSCALGDSVFIGREPDFAIDPGCRWYKLHDMTTAIDTVSGLWVKPVGTTTYVVRQELECSSLKWDTVVVFANPVGWNDLILISNQIKIYPVPAKEKLTLWVSIADTENPFTETTIYNRLGQIVKFAKICFHDQITTVSISGIQNGLYVLGLRNNTGVEIYKRIVIEN